MVNPVLLELDEQLDVLGSCGDTDSIFQCIQCTCRPDDLYRLNIHVYTHNCSLEGAMKLKFAPL